MKVRGVLYIPTYEYNYKVIIGCDTILQDYYITDRHKCENTKKFTYMNSKKTLPSYKRKTREMSKRAWKDRALDGLPMVHASATLLWSVTGRILSSKLWNLNMKIQGSQNSPASGVTNSKWRAKITHAYHKSESEACTENCVMSISMQEQIKRQQVK